MMPVWVEILPIRASSNRRARHGGRYRPGPRTWRPTGGARPVQAGRFPAVGSRPSSPDRDRRRRFRGTRPRREWLSGAGRHRRQPTPPLPASRAPMAMNGPCTAGRPDKRACVLHPWTRSPSSRGIRAMGGDGITARCGGSPGSRYPGRPESASGPACRTACRRRGSGRCRAARSSGCASRGRCRSTIP